eukprot:m.14178 g.14178  ORF g.14178 m.14178 type:complete len:105 (+) comp25601_c0_seq2:65-379(+)
MASSKKYRVSLIGSGNWGTAIARIIGENVKKSDQFEDRVPMWVFEEMVDGRKLSEIINNDHENVKYLPGFKIPHNIARFMQLRKCVYRSLICCPGGHPGCSRSS